MIIERQKILVTGAHGMLGHALTKELSHDYQLIGIDIEDADITDENQIKEEIFKIRPDIVINSAAYTNVDNCEKNKELAYRINAKGAENIARACKLSQAKLIHISTDFVFDGKKNTPYTEDDTPNPINTYGASKLEGEKIIQSIWENHLIIRTAWLYGYNGKNFVDTILRLASSEPELKVVNDQTGSPTYTIDLAKAINLIVKKDAIGTMHITNSGSCTWHEFAVKILSLKGISKKVKPITSDKLGPSYTNHNPNSSMGTSKFPYYKMNRLAKRPSYSVLSTEKFQEMTGTKLRSWDKALEEYLG